MVLVPRTDPPRGGGGAFRYDHFDRTARWEAFDLDPPRTAAFRDAVQQTVEHRDVANPAYALRTRDENARHQILVKALRKALEKPTSDPAASLMAVAAAWGKLSPEGLEEYRTSLWLSAR